MEDKKQKDIAEDGESPKVTDTDEVSETSVGDELETASEESASKVEEGVGELTDSSSDSAETVDGEKEEKDEDSKEVIEDKTSDATEVETTIESSVVESTPETEDTKEESESSEGSDNKGKSNYLLAFFAIAVILGLLWMGLEKQDRVSTNVFEGVFSAIGGSQSAAVVNGVKISVEDYDDNVSQLQQNASLQGLDITDPGLDTEIKSQALTILVNTELLRQEVLNKEIVATEEQIEEKLNELTGQIGGPEALAAQLETVGVTEAELRDDIKYEIEVEFLLEQELSFGDITVSEEEMIAQYEVFGGEEAGLPPYEDVRVQIQSQVLSQKQQELLQVYIDGLREDSEIEELI